MFIRLGYYEPEATMLNNWRVGFNEELKGWSANKCESPGRGFDTFF